MESIAEQPLGRLLTAIAAAEPAPGAGAAAAAALALGIACAGKAVAISARHGLDARGGDRLAELGAQALALGDADARGFAALIAGEDGAAAALTALGRESLRLADRARAAIERTSPAIHPSMRGDLLAAGALVEAAATIIRANLAENEGS